MKIQESKKGGRREKRMGSKILSMMKTFSEKMSRDDAIDVFKQICSLPKHGTRDLNVFFSRLVKSNQHELVLILCNRTDLQLLKLPDIVTWNILVNCFSSKYDSLSHALCIMGKMLKLGFPPNAATYGPIVKCACDPMKLNILKHMQEDGVVIDAKRYNMSIETLCKHVKLPEALKLFKEMDSKMIKPDIYTFNSVVRGLCKADIIGESEELMLDMVRKGVAYDVATYSGILNGYAKRGLTKPAEEMFEKMISMKVFPNVRGYNNIIECYCFNSKNLDAATRTFREMKCHSNQVTFNILIQVYLKAGRNKDVIELLSTIVVISTSLTSFS